MPAALSLATATILMVAPSRNFLEIYPHSPRSTEPPGMYEGVGESGICLLVRHHFLKNCGQRHWILSPIIWRDYVTSQVAYCALHGGDPDYGPRGPGIGSSRGGDSGLLRE